MWTGYLSFGLVNVPVGLYSATVDQTLHFNQLRAGTSHRVRYKKVDEVTGEELAASDIESGYDVGDGEYVVVTKEDLAAASPGKSDAIEITDFVELREIDPIQFRQSYYLAPRGKGSERAYALLRQAMADSGKVAIATIVMRDKSHLVAVRPGAKSLVLETMYFADEIRDPASELDTLPGDVELNPRELDIAQQLINSLTATWDAGSYHDEYRNRLSEIVEQKRAGQQIVVREERPKSNVVDLMAALEASVARAGSSRGVPADSEASGRLAKSTDAEPRPSHAQQSFAGMSKAELLARAAELDLAGRSKMSKLELVEALESRARRKVS
jgi:DNA end-binding protein Ku